MIQCMMDTLGMTEETGKKKSWMDLKSEVCKLRRQLSCLSVPVPSSLSFRTLSDGRTRIYFLSTPTYGWEMTLLYVDVLTGDFTRNLKWHPLVEPSVLLSGAGRFSREEQLQWERKRLATWGITTYEMHAETGKLVFPAASSLFQCTDTGFGSGVLCPAELRSCPPGAKLNPQICPTNPNLVAYVCNNDVWVTLTSSGNTRRLTFLHRSDTNLSDDPFSAGIPSYVMQEEFNRYLGFWWQPTSCDMYSVYRILYEEVDESEVKVLCFPSSSPSNMGEVEELRFPRAGTPNAKSELKIVQFRVSNAQQITDVVTLQLRSSLLTMFPWAEYLVRAGWTPNAEHIWMQLLDRRQRRLELVLVRTDEFLDSSEIDSDVALPWTPTPLILYSQVSELWINVHDILFFLPYDKNSETISFIWASEETGWRHLYLVNSLLAPAINGSSQADHAEIPVTGRKVALTIGEWEVLGKNLWVDVTRQLVYFLGLKETPLEKHLYVVSLRKPGEVRLLTTVGHSYSVDFDESCSLMVCVYSNTHTLPACQVFKIVHSDWTVHGVTMVSAGFLLEPRSAVPTYSPLLCSHQISSGDSLFAMVFKPHTFCSGKKYPTVVNIYGGPEVQLVSNTFKGMRQLRMHMLAAQGYCVVAIDSRGSVHRGLAFEGHLRGRMGTVELADQVEMLRYLSDSLGYIDMTRIAIHGWSYGGYLSLMSLVQYPDIFKIAIAGAPVTSWSLYDTGYTERYMDLPELNRLGYTIGSVLNYVKQFPEEENRLLIIHGLIDENVHFFHTSQFVNAMVKEGKPYQLQVYPNERHSLRNMDASKHYETMLLSFLQNHL